MGPSFGMAGHDLGQAFAVSRSVTPIWQAQVPCHVLFLKRRSVSGT